VRLEEFLIRPRSDQFKLVVLNKRLDRLDTYYYQGTFNKDLPRDLSVALRQLGGGLDVAPEYYLKAFETGRSSQMDSIVEKGTGGHLVDLNGNSSSGDNVVGFLNPVTDTFENADGRAVYKTLFDHYGFYVNGKLKHGWTGSNIQQKSDASLASTNDPITGAALPTALPIRTVTVEIPESDDMHKRVIETFSDGTYIRWDNFDIDENGRIVSKADFAGPLSGPAYEGNLLKHYREQVITASEFHGRKIDLVLEPKTLILAGLIQ
jgi:hypothetical protein